MKTHLPVLMIALSLIASTARAKIPKEATMNLTSPDFREGGNIPEGFTCDGKDISPTLKIDGIPKEAKSLMVIVDDPDAPGREFYPLADLERCARSNRDRGKQAAIPRRTGSERFWKKQI